MVTRYEPDAAGTYRQLTELLRDRHGQHIFSEDGAQVDDQVAQLLAGADLEALHVLEADSGAFEDAALHRPDRFDRAGDPR